MDFDSCSEVINNKIITVKENNMQFILLNKKQLTINKVIVDGCLIGDSNEKCDYLFEVPNNKKIESVLYVELKGKDIKKAFSQLSSTIIQCATEHANTKKTCYIIASRVPKAGPQIQVLKKKMMLTLTAQLFVSTNRAEVKIS